MVQTLTSTITKIALISVNGSSLIGIMLGIYSKVHGNYDEMLGIAFILFAINAISWTALLIALFIERQENKQML